MRYIVLLFLLMIAFPASAGVQNIKCKGQVCMVRNDPGGIIGDYLIKLKDMRSKGQRLEVDERCDSSCTFMAAYGPYSYHVPVCITRRATFGFHMGVFEKDFSDKIPAGTEISVYPPAFKKWIASKKGLPSNKSGRIQPMSNREARQFWPLCK